MALTERLAILIDASSGGAVREFQKLSGAAGKTDVALTKGAKAGAAFKGALGAIGLTTIAAGMLGFAKASIDAASALEEAENKASVVFGSSFPKVSEFARETADAFNLSERAALDFAGAFAPVFKNAGFGADAVADLSTALTAFTADFASFNNLSIDEAFQKIQSGLAGETEAVRRYGIDVSAAAVQTEAYAMGIAEVGDKLTEAQKIQARTSLILKDGADAMGDSARTADSYANVQKDLAENVEDLSASIGQFLTPAVSESVDTLSTLVEVLGKVIPEADAAGDSAFDLGDTLSNSVSPIGFLVGQYQQLQDGLSGVKGLFGESAEEAGRSAESLYETADAALRSSLGNEELADSADLAADAAKAESDAIDDLASAIEGLGSKFSDADAAQDGLTESISDAREPFRELRDAQKELASATDESARKAARQKVEAAKAAITMKGNSEAALKNRDALRELASKTLQSAAAMTTLDGDTERAAAETRRGRVAFIEIATQFGLTKKEARTYADQLGLIQKDVKSNVALDGVEKAKADAKAVRDAVLSIPQFRQVEIRTKATKIIGESEARASGGPVSAGKTYMVGEQGPELLRLQGSNGVITPNSRSAVPQATGPTYNVYGYPDEATLRALERREQLASLKRRMAT